VQQPTWQARALALAGLALCLANTGLAEDLFPPCWRGGAGATYENWSFSSSSNPASPEAFTNPNGIPQAAISVGSYGTGWSKGPFLDRTNMWDIGLNGQISLAIPNFGGSATSWKYLEVQVTYFSDGTFYLPPTTSIAGATNLSSQVVNNQASGPGVWYTAQSVWLVQPALASETVLVASGASQGAIINQVVIDTLCPAPGQKGVSLSIQVVGPNGGQVQISWQGGLPGVVLQSNARLDDPNGWSKVQATIQTLGCISSVTLDAVDGLRFYRLKQL